MNTSPALSLPSTPAGEKAEFPATSDRLPWLDGLRGIAALAVVLHHIYAIALHYYAGSALLENPVVKLVMTVGRWGLLGVPCFFVLSGFCVGQTWLRARSPGKFALRRWRRIFPAYYASLVLVLFCAGGVRLATGVNDIATIPPVTATNVLATLTLMTAPASQTPMISWVYWTLSYEVVFYLVLTGLLLVPARARLIVLCLVHVAVTAIGVWPGLTLAPGVLFFADLWPLFGLGLALALISQSRITAATIALLSLSALIPLQLGGKYAGFGASALVAMGFVALCQKGFPLPRWHPLEKLGEFSYSLYLMHVPILLAVGKYFVLRPNQTPALWLLGCLAAIALMVVAAYGFYRLFERPFISTRPISGPSVTA
jgi:peptidoglycan/LPS O-acetylase OafA/YrhL